MERSAELELLIECCRRNFHGQAAQRSSSAIDWHKFLALTKFHRVVGLAHRALLLDDGDAPAFVTESLAAAAAANAARNLLMTAESRAISAAFDAAGVPLIFVKGLTLSALAYGNAALKSAIDIDILIDPADLVKAATCLRETQFDLVTPRRSLQRWHRTWKESIWRSSRTAIQLDLHTRLADDPRLISGISVRSPRQMVDVGSVILPTLATDKLLTYLAVHGASSGWFRLKWIADFAALLSRQSGEYVGDLDRISQGFGGGRAVRQALLLADSLFGTVETSSRCRNALFEDAGLRRLVRRAEALISHAPVEPTNRFLGTLPIHLSQLAIAPSPRSKLAAVQRKAGQLITRLTI